MFLIIGHRGAAGYKPENTLSSFQKAIELNVDMIEMDVFACRTGELVVIHDYTVDRTTNGKGFIWDLDFKELRTLDAGDGEKIPTLEEALDIIDGKVKVNIELKGENTAQPVLKVIEKYVKKKNLAYEDFYISSFNHYVLDELISLKRNDQAIHISPLILGIPLGFADYAAKFNAFSINLSSEFINTSIVNDAHNKGIKVFVYVIDTADDLVRMKTLGVDGVISNYPDIIRRNI